jgi:putative peptide zinc metalloprotease protein
MVRDGQFAGVNWPLLLNPKIKCSPPVAERFTLYFGDRNTTASVHVNEWNQLIQQLRDGSTPSQIYAACSPFIDQQAYPDPETYLRWLEESGIILQAAPPRGGLPASPFHSARESSDRPTQPASGASDRVCLFDVKNILETLHLHIPRGFVTVQLILWPFLVGLFFISVYLFYFSPTAIGPSLTHGSNALFGLARVLTLFFGVNLVGTIIPILASIALGINDSKLYFQWTLGFHPGFYKDTTFREYRERATPEERAFLIGQSLLAKMYLATICIVLISLYLRIPSGPQGWITSILLATVQISLIDIVFDLVPIGNTTTTKLLAIRGVIPKGLFLLTVQRMKENVYHLRHGEWNQLRHFWSFIYLVLFALTIGLKLAMLFLLIVPSLSMEMPLILGYWTPIIIRIGLVFLVLRYFFIRLSSRFAPGGQPSSSPGVRQPLSGQERPLSRLPVPPPTASPSPSPKSWMARFLRSKRLFLLLLLLILFLPFPATISASTVVTESKGLDIRASEEALITQLNAEGPSEQKIPKGFTLMILSSPELQANYDSTKQEIYNLDAQIRAAKIQLRSLESGSAALTTKGRDDELAIALADEKRYAAEVASFKEQLELIQKTVESYAELVKSGAVSELQLRTWLTTKEQLIGQLASAQENLNSARSTINKAKRNKYVDQDVRLQEDLSAAKETLEGATRKRSQSVIALGSLNERLAKFKIVMPFDGVVSSATTGLLNRRVAAGETLLTVKALPLTSLVAMVPDYDRNKLNVGMRCVVRLYSDPHREFDGKIASISSATVTEDDLKYIEVKIEINESLPTNYIGTMGYAKVVYGQTFLLRNLLEPILRFFNLDLWSYLP